MKLTKTQKIKMLLKASIKYRERYEGLNDSDNPQCKEMAIHNKATADAYDAVIHLLQYNSPALL